MFVFLAWHLSQAWQCLMDGYRYWLNRVPDDEAQAVIASDPQSDGQGIVDVGMEHVQTINAEASSVMDEELANDRVSTRDTSETQSSDSRLAPISGAET